MILRNDNSLIGDFIGTIPAMIELAKRNNGLDVICSDSVVELLEMIPAKYGINRVYSETWDKSFDLHAAFAFADGAKKLHMIQANYNFVGLEVPEGIPRPELDEKKPNYFGFVDATLYCLSPFSRSLPENQKWQQSKWQELVNRLPNKKFALLGAGSDTEDFVTGDNVYPFFNQSLHYVSSVMKQCHGLISVVTGTSHLAYALGVKNYLFFMQGLWGKNPDAILFEKHVPDVSVEEVIERLINDSQ